MSKRKPMTYNERSRIELEFFPVDQVICGYIRNPYRQNDNLRGICALNHKKCTRRLPNDPDNCQIYKTWLEQRIKEIRSGDGK